MAAKSSDAPYKVLFQDPGLFEETVRLVAPKLADALDFETATALDKEHLTQLALTRVQDKLRRVEFKTGRLRNGRRRYVLVLTEYQSSQDRDMAWRMREYLHLVEADLREAGRARAEGAVPPMLSVVVHNGERPWRAGAEWAPLAGDGPPALARMYATVDLRVLARGPDPEGRTLAQGSRLAMLAELEAASVERLPGLLLAAFRRYDGAESAGLRRGLHERVAAALARVGAAEELPPLAELERRLARRRGEGDMVGMLEATLERWQEANVARGAAQGMERGLAEGVQRGLAEGVQRGLAEGVQRGLAEGAAQGRVALLRRLAARRFGTDVAGQVAALLADVTDVAQLDEAGDWVVDCDTGEGLLARLAGGRKRGRQRRFGVTATGRERAPRP